MIILADVASFFGSAMSILWVILGLGLVIFFHELGHFAVAKWCGVYCERFAIGFGPAIWKKQWGETEYVLAAIPFGGYVKMLGQDDANPEEMTNKEIALDPRSYSAKSVPQRMAIISAGVIMNVLTAILFFAGAFAIGHETPAPVVGGTSSKLPAWEAGIDSGDTILEVNHEPVSAFRDLMIGVALSTDNVHIKAKKPDGTVYEVNIKPNLKGTRRTIGLNPQNNLQLVPDNPEGVNQAEPGTPAAAAEGSDGNGLMPADLILELDGERVSSFHHLRQLLARKRDKAVVFTVRRDDSENTATITIGPNRFRRLGLKMDIGKVRAVRKGSPAEEAGIEVGDKLVSVKLPGGEKRDIGSDLDPLRLPDFFAEHAGKAIEVGISRTAESGGQTVSTVTLSPTDRPGWLEAPRESDEPLVVASLGLAYTVQPVVVQVIPGSPAAKAGLKPEDRIEKITLTRPDDAEDDGIKDKVKEIPFTGEYADHNWAFAFWTMQMVPQRTVTLTVSSGGESRDVELAPIRDLKDPSHESEWFLPVRGFHTTTQMITLESDGFFNALGMGVDHSVRTCVQIYLTLRNLFGGLLSPKELHGPIGIAKVAYRVAERGMADLLIFLGFLSINLAVLNFLPIPVLDGGHMVFLIWEGITRRKPSDKVMIATTWIGLLFILGLMVFVIYLDLFVHKI